MDSLNPSGADAQRHVARTKEITRLQPRGVKGHGTKQEPRCVLTAAAGQPTELANARSRRVLGTPTLPARFASSVDADLAGLTMSELLGKYAFLQARAERRG